MNSVTKSGNLKNSGKFVNQSENLLLKNDLVMVLSDIAHGLLLGRTAIITQNNKYVLNQRVALLRPRLKIVNPLFLSNLLNSHQIYFHRMGIGTSQLNINKASVVNSKWYLPKIEEQKEIGQILELINNLSVLQQRKRKILKSLKRAMLQKVLASNQSDYPCLRFANFKDKWKQEQLGKIAKILMGQSPSSKNYTNNSKYPVLVQGNADLKGGKISPRVWTKEKTRIIRKNEIIMTVRAPVGCLAIANMDAVIGRGVAAISGNKFLYFLLQTKLIDGTWQKVSVGSTFGSISSNDIKKLKIKITNNYEEKEISEFLSRIDQTNNFQQHRIKIIKEFKQFLLQNMFI